MGIAKFGQFNYPTPEEVRAQLLSDLRYGYRERLGININVGPNTEPYIRATAVMNQLSLAIANNQLARDEINPFKLTGIEPGSPLVVFCGIFGVTARGPVKSRGFLEVRTALLSTIFPPTFYDVSIPKDFRATFPTGAQVDVLVGKTVNNLQPIEVQAVLAGSAGDIPAGTLGNWDEPTIPHLLATVAVTAGGIDGGKDGDNEEELRDRLFKRLGLPSVGGNRAHVADLAEKSSAGIANTFIHAALHGPSSYDVVLVSDEADRKVPDFVVQGAASAILAELPGPMALEVSTVETEQLDIIIDVDAPLPQQAGGSGGGFLSSTPYPSGNETGVNVFAEITSIANLLTQSQVTVNSTSTDPPIVGNQIGIWNPLGGDELDGEMNEFTIIQVTGSSGAYILKLDTTQGSALDFITTGMYLSVGMTNLKTYADQVKKLFRLLGSGEKTDNVDILLRGRRWPLPDFDAPYKVTHAITAQLMSSFKKEILDASFAGRFATGTKTTKTTPGIPLTTDDPPKILVMKHLSFRRKI